MLSCRLLFLLWWCKLKQRSYLRSVPMSTTETCWEASTFTNIRTWSLINEILLWRRLVILMWLQQALTFNWSLLFLVEQNLMSWTCFLKKSCYSWRHRLLLLWLLCKFELVLSYMSRLTAIVRWCSTRIFRSSWCLWVTNLRLWLYLSTTLETISCCCILNRL